MIINFKNKLQTLLPEVLNEVTYLNSAYDNTNEVYSISDE